MVLKKCVICGKEFAAKEARIHAKLCSNACRYKYQSLTRKGENNVRWTGPDRVKMCVQCGVLFRWNVPWRKFCSMACTKLGQKRLYGKEHPRHNDASKRRNAKGESARQIKWAARVITRDLVCQHCGTNERLCAHHILPWRLHPERRDDVANGLTLCTTCHRRLHRSSNGKSGEVGEKPERPIPSQSVHVTRKG